MASPRGALVACSLLLAVHTGGATQRSPEPDGIPFSCEPGAVTVDISRSPGVRFVPVDRPLLPFYDGHGFIFTAGPIRRVNVYLAATLPEAGVGRATDAGLSVVVETSAGLDTSTPSRWWQLVPARDADPFAAAATLLFDANDVRPCFNGEPCRFADLTRAADDAVPLVVLGFTRDLGGANANNWEHARLVLDFRGSEPRVAVAADCGYNEGGGACTAIDSGNMARSDLSCPWNAAAGDFLCSEGSDLLGHRDFQLLSGRPGPGRDGEAPTLDDAARRLAAGAPGPIVVTGLSPVRLVHEAALGNGRVLVFAAAGGFHVAERTASGLGPLIPVATRGLAVDPPPDRSELSNQGWTSEEDPVFRADEISRQGSSVVLRVLRGRQDDGSAPMQPSRMDWLGVERRGGALRADALTLVAPGSYNWCGQDAVPTVVTAVGRIGRPFDAAVTVQPPTTTNMDGEVVWRGNERMDEVQDCRRPGRVRWLDGRFDVAIGADACKADEPPFYVDLGPDGAIRVSPSVREP